MQLDVESMRTLAAVLDLGGMTRAAESLGLSQSAVSWKIKRLEDRVGRDLLIREGRSIRPTRTGRELLDLGRRMVELHDEAVRRLDSSELTGSVKLGATDEVSAAFMGGVLGRFNRSHPGASLEFVVDKGATLDEMLHRSELDLAVFEVRPNAVRDGDTVLWRDHLVWVTAPDWTYEEGEVPLITFGDGGFYRPIAEAALRTARIPYRIGFSGTSTASVVAAAEAGLGVAVLSSRSAVGDIVPWPRSGELPLPPSLVQIARSSPGEPSAVAAELTENIISELGEY